MNIHITYLGKKQVIKLAEKSTVVQLLSEMGINRETVLVGREKEIIPDSAQLKDGDSLELIRTISGG